MNDADYEGLDENQNTYFYRFLHHICTFNADKVKINPDKLYQYVENICRHVRQIGKRRGRLTLKYYQYIALLFTEIYFDRYFSDHSAFLNNLNAYFDLVGAKTMGQISFAISKERI